MVSNGTDAYWNSDATNGGFKRVTIDSFRGCWERVDTILVSSAPRYCGAREKKRMATNKPAGDNARKGAMKKRSQTKTTMDGASTWTKRDKTSGEFMAVKKAKKAAPNKAKKKTAKKTTVAKKFKGVRREKK
jgi:hypothetical protein